MYTCQKSLYTVKTLGIRVTPYAYIYIYIYIYVNVYVSKVSIHCKDSWYPCHSVCVCVYIYM